MQGTIIQFNPHSGDGKIETASKNVYPFNMAVWTDFSDMPTTGLVVDFSIDDDENVTRAVSKNIRVEIEKPRPSLDDDSSGQQETQTQNESSDKKAPSKETARPSTEKEEFVKPEEEEITITMSVQETMDSYFKQVTDTIDQYSPLLDSDKELNFAKMKRFLFTGYNNLYELDNHLTDAKMEALKHELETLQKDYELFSHKIRYPVDYAFEKIFLSSQQGFEKLTNSIEYTHSQIQMFSLKEKPIIDSMKMKEKQLANIRDKHSKEYEKVENQLKTIKKRYVDLLHYVGTLRDDLKKMTEKIEHFKEQYLPEFTQNYESLSRYLDAKMIKILNVKAYQFDTELWQRAKKSKNIRQFFMDSGIEGTYSSKTFLKYYLRTLDRNKMNQENKELFDLLVYLESLGADTILVIRNSIDSAARCKYLIENIDKDITVMTTHDPHDSFRLCLQKRPDIVILDYHLRTMSAFEYIKKYKEKYVTDTNVLPTFCMLVEEANNRLLQDAKKNSVKYVIPANLNDTEFIDKLREIL